MDGDTDRNSVTTQSPRDSAITAVSLVMSILMSLVSDPIQLTILATTEDDRAWPLRAALLQLHEWSISTVDPEAANMLPCTPTRATTRRTRQTWSQNQATPRVKMNAIHPTADVAPTATTTSPHLRKSALAVIRTMPTLASQSVTCHPTLLVTTAATNPSPPRCPGSESTTLMAHLSTDLVKATRAPAHPPASIGRNSFSAPTTMTHLPRLQSLPYTLAQPMPPAADTTWTPTGTKICVAAAMVAPQAVVLAAEVARSDLAHTVQLDTQAAEALASPVLNVAVPRIVILAMDRRCHTCLADSLPPLTLTLMITTKRFMTVFDAFSGLLFSGKAALNFFPLTLLYDPSPLLLCDSYLTTLHRTSPASNSTAQALSTGFLWHSSILGAFSDLKAESLLMAHWILH